MPCNRRGSWARFVAVARPFFQRETRWHALALIGLLVALILALSGLNVTNSFVVGRYTDALKDGQTRRFTSLVFAFLLILAGTAAVAGFKRFAEDRLALRWRERLTRHLLARYLANHAYYRLNGRSDIDNPDQRIAEDVKTFTTTAVSFITIGLNSTSNLCAFAGVLWAISPWLLLAAVLYAGFGTLATVLVGRRLVAYDICQLRKEADFRFDLIQVRTHAEPIALLRGEARERGRLGGRLTAVVENMLRIIRLNRNITFFIEGYKSLIPVIPTVIVGSLYLRGRADFGEVSQAIIAFGFVVNAFSVIVEEFQTISAFGAVVERLGAAWGAIDEAPEAKSMIEVTEDESEVAYEGLTLVTPRDGRLLVNDLTARVPRGRRLLLSGPHGCGRSALLRATAWLWTAGQGRITRPPLDDVLFLPQQPYLPPGSLRDLLLYSGRNDGVSDDRMLEVLTELNFDDVLQRAGGLDTERDWGKLLSLGEQQVLAFARLILANPRFAFLDEATTGLDNRRAERLYEILARTPITYITVGTDPSLVVYHDVHLEVYANGSWAVRECGQAAGV